MTDKSAPRNAEREARIAAALRANLRRRKAAVKDRLDDPSSDEAPAKRDSD